MKENNNPEIQETFRFQHSPASKQPLLLQVSDDHHFQAKPVCITKDTFTLCSILNFQVYDWDRFSKNDLMGEVKNIANFENENRK